MKGHRRSPGGNDIVCRRVCLGGGSGGLGGLYFWDRDGGVGGGGREGTLVLSMCWKGTDSMQTLRSEERALGIRRKSQKRGEKVIFVGEKNSIMIL